MMTDFIYITRILPCYERKGYNMKFGLALSGGALRGTAHIGVLKALWENNLFPSWVSGTSAGSMFASLYACGYTPFEMEEIALRQGKEIFDADYLGMAGSALQWVFTRQLHLDGIIKGKRLEAIFKELTGGRNIKEARVPLAITAVNINNGQSVLFVSNKYDMKDSSHLMVCDDVPIYKAVRASIAIPVVFKPIMINGMRLVDGGLSENLPIRVLKDMGAQITIGINIGYSGQMRKEVDNILEIGNQTIDIMGYHITRLSSGEANLIINPGIYDVGLTEIEKIPDCIRRGYEAAINNMNLIKSTIKGDK
jgi:NTE family protein